VQVSMLSEVCFQYKYEMLR